MASEGRRRRKPAPRAVRAPRTPRAGQEGGPFAEEKPQRIIASGPKRAKLRADEAEENFRAVHTEDGTRLQKVLAAAGVASRRVSEQLIAEGRVAVNGRIVIEPGVRVDPQVVSIHVDGVPVSLDVTHRYVMFNKPAKVVSTMHDPQGRSSIDDFLDEEHRAAGLFHVGRLDYETEGLLLLTNDGELAHRLTHPSYEVPKTYLVEAAGAVSVKTARKLQSGIELEDGSIAADRCWVHTTTGNRSMVEVTLHSGRNRIVRRMFEAVGHPVQRLVRTAFGQITIGDQPQGTVRDLGIQEVGHLKDLVSGEPHKTSSSESSSPAGASGGSAADSGAGDPDSGPTTWTHEGSR
ncbi:pseudouridine synthase [Nesterenkonia alba]|uniref:pseudouridine synthase n=1 Tax=Nesterenkonia alba TaxID=515814 RepID=UPI0003B68493|nr:pseudouridine synthase [Nesterenkonia alba]